MDPRMFRALQVASVCGGVAGTVQFVYTAGKIIGPALGTIREVTKGDDAEDSWESAVFITGGALAICCYKALVSAMAVAQYSLGLKLIWELFNELREPTEQLENQANRREL